MTFTSTGLFTDGEINVSFVRGGYLLFARLQCRSTGAQTVRWPEAVTRSLYRCGCPFKILVLKDHQNWRGGLSNFGVS